MRGLDWTLWASMVLTLAVGASVGAEVGVEREPAASETSATSSVNWIRFDGDVAAQALDLSLSTVTRYCEDRQQAGLKSQQLPERGLVAMSDEELILWLCDHTSFAFDARVLCESVSAVTGLYNAASALLQRPSAAATLVREMTILDKQQVMRDVCGEGGYRKENRFVTILYLMRARLGVADEQERKRMFSAVLAQCEIAARSGHPESLGGIFSCALEFLEDIMRDAGFDEYTRWKKEVVAQSEAPGLPDDNGWVQDYLRIARSYVSSRGRPAKE